MKKETIISGKRHCPSGLLLTGLLALVAIWTPSCRKFVGVPAPSSMLTGATVYSNNASAAAVLTSIYSRMSQGGLSTGTNSISIEAGLAADELKNYTSNAVLSQFYTNSLTSLQPYFWTELYQEIYVANAAIDGLSSSTALSPDIKQQMMGEAKFMRAFLHFYAVNLYGDVPLVTTTNYQDNNILARTPSATVYQQVIADLKEAQSDLSDTYLDPTGAVTPARVRPNKGAATALLARAYIYTQKWDSAEMESSILLNNSSAYGLDGLDSVFLMNSTEAIWQLQPVKPSYNTLDGAAFILTAAPNVSSPVSVGVNLLNAFETGDNRRKDWIGSYTKGATTYYYPYKYKVKGGSTSTPITEYLMVLRLGEQYLIRAEARAEQNNITGPAGALADLDVIRSRAGLPDYAGATDQPSVLSAILHERQVELFTEWGHRWLDLKRTASVDSVMTRVTPQKGGQAWNTNWQLMPIPLTEITADPNLNQNNGY